jgi:flagellar hook-basal body complex protein FliE
MVDRVDIQGVLEQMRNLRSQVNIPEQTSSNSDQFANTVEQMRKQISSATDSNTLNGINNSVSEVANDTLVGDVPSFGEMFKSAVDTVNDTQGAAKDLATRYEMGDPKVDLPEVMIALQKSSVSFQAMTQVRNKMIEAYKEIINMPL